MESWQKIKLFSYAVIAEMNLLNGFGKCPACNSWNTFYEEKIMKVNNASVKRSEAMEIVKLNTVEVTKHNRYKTKCDELDRVLGGGLVQGSLVLLGGEPGIRKINVNITNM